MRGAAFAVAAVLAAAAAVAAVAQAAKPGPAPQASPAAKIEGAVAKPGVLDAARLASLPTAARKVKTSGADGAYRASVELRGAGLRDLLDAADVRKTTDDGFNRPLDTLVEVVGAKGEKALFSYGEIFLGRDPQRVVVAAARRFVWPHHHADVGFDGAAVRGADEELPPAAAGCANCHDGKARPALDAPRGIVVADSGDLWPARFVEDVVSIRVRQAGVALDKAKAKKDARAESAALVGPNGPAAALGAKEFARFAPRSWREASFGEGRGYRGVHVWRGADLADVVRPLLPKGADPRRVFVLVTAADGYRSAFSGTEVFFPTGSPVLLADACDGKPLEGGAGRFAVVATGDFYVDRGVRAVSEIRLLVD